MLSLEEKLIKLVDQMYLSFVRGDKVINSLAYLRDYLSASNCCTGVIVDNKIILNETTSEFKDAAEIYQKKYALNDPVYHEVHNTNKSRILFRSNFMDMDHHKSTDLYNEVLKPQGHFEEAIIIVQSESGAKLWLTFGFPETLRLDASTYGTLHFLYPHIERCLRLFETGGAFDEKIELPLDHVNLTSQETSIIELLWDGCTYAEISTRLSISKNTLKWHMKNIFQKYDAPNLASLLIKLKRKT